MTIKVRILQHKTPDASGFFGKMLATS